MMQINVSHQHYTYLHQQASDQGKTIETLLSEMIEAQIAWQKTLVEDPIYQLIGQMNDPFDTQQIQEVLYGV